VNAGNGQTLVNLAVVRSHPATLNDVGCERRVDNRHGETLSRGVVQERHLDGTMVAVAW
jgi:hypothetical protein